MFPKLQAVIFAVFVSTANACATLKSTTSLYAFIEYSSPTCSLSTGQHILFPELDVLCQNFKSAGQHEVLEDVVHQTPLDNFITTTSPPENASHPPFSNKRLFAPAQCYTRTNLSPQSTLSKPDRQTTVVYRSGSTTRSTSHVSFRESPQRETSTPRTEDDAVLLTGQLFGVPEFVIYQPVLCIGTLFMMGVMGYLFSEL